MSPLGIEMLLHYHTRCEDYRQGDFSAPSVRELMDYFLGVGMLEPATGQYSNWGMQYQPTEGTRVYVDALKALQLPVKKWVMP